LSNANVTSTCRRSSQSGQYPPIYWCVTVAVCDRCSGTRDTRSYCVSPPWLIIHYIYFNLLCIWRCGPNGAGRSFQFSGAEDRKLASPI